MPRRLDNLSLIYGAAVPLSLLVAVVAWTPVPVFVAIFCAIAYRMRRLALLVQAADEAEDRARLDVLAQARRAEVLDRMSRRARKAAGR